MSIQFDKVINKGLRRPLSPDELTAVTWWLNIIGFGDNYDNALKSLIICGGIKNIQHYFIKYRDNPEWIEKTRKEYRELEQWTDEENLAELERQERSDAIRAIGELGNLIVDSVAVYGRHMSK